MVTIPYRGILDVALRYGYQLPVFPTMAGYGWNPNARDAVCGATRQQACHTILCRSNGYVFFQSNPVGSFSGNSWQEGFITEQDNRYALTYMTGNDNAPTGMFGWAANVVGTPSPTGLLRTVNAHGLSYGNITPVSNGTNVIGCFRSGNNRAQFAVRGLSAATPKQIWLYGEGGMSLAGTTPINLSATGMISRWPQSGGGGGTATINWERGWRSICMRNGFANVECWTFDLDGNAVLDTVTLGVDPNNTNTLYTNTSQAQTFSIVAAAQFGFFNSLGGAAIFPGMGSRIIYYAKDLGGWYDVRLTALDSQAAATIALSAGTLTIGQDGHYYYKRDNSGATGRDVLISPEPPRQVLPFIVPMGGLPRYGVYDKPYGVER